MVERPDEDAKKSEDESTPSGFTVVDRRGQEKPEEKKAEAPPDKEKGEESAGVQAPESPKAPPEGKAAPPPINFVTLVLSLSSSALIQLGEIPDPFTKKTEKNLTAAQQTIDILGMLDEKTKGNLSPEESQTLEAALYDLRLRYLKASGHL
jgi:hypothetical protein